MNNFKIGIFGGAGVGKSAITIMFIRGFFHEKYSPTIEDIYRKNIYINNILYRVEIIDTSGSTILDKNKSKYESYLREIDGAIFVFSLTSDESLINIINKHDDFVCNNPKKVAIICATQYDKTSERCITTERCRNLSYGHRYMIYETSAKTGYNIKRIFNVLLRLLFEGSENIKKAKTSCVLL